ncbi:hypothetical protein AB4427_14730 [Vibrio artabrorum]|uniref:hypothetical protein n=1 Tax=Vibrio artabrorum TaxID=446374 RepID=UPI003550B80F
MLSNQSQTHTNVQIATNVSTLDSLATAQNDISKSVTPVGLSRDIALSEFKPVENIVVIGAHVKARARHSSVWLELTVLFPETELNKPYWGQGIARGHVITETRRFPRACPGYLP